MIFRSESFMGAEASTIFVPKKPFRSGRRCGRFPRDESPQAPSFHGFAARHRRGAGDRTRARLHDPRRRGSLRSGQRERVGRLRRLRRHELEQRAARVHVGRGPLVCPRAAPCTGYVCCPGPNDRDKATTDICRGNPVAPGSDASIPDTGADATSDQSTSDVDERLAERRHEQRLAERRRDRLAERRADRLMRGD